MQFNLKNILTLISGLVELGNAWFPFVPAGICVGVGFIARGALSIFYSTDAE